MGQKNKSDITTKLAITLNSAVMHALFNDLLTGRYTDDNRGNLTVSLNKYGQTWYCNVDADEKSGSFQFDMDSLIANGLVNMIIQQKEQLYEYFKNEIYTQINIDVIKKDPDTATEHMDIVTLFEEPDESMVSKKVDEFYLAPVIDFMYTDTFGKKNLISVPVTKSLLADWNMDADTVFELAFESVDRRLAIENFNKKFNDNPEVNKGKIFYSVYEKGTDNLYGNVYQNMYSAKFRQYIADNYEKGAFVSFPHKSIGFIWPKDKLSVIDSVTIPPDVLSSETYTFNNVIHFDDELSKYDKQMKKQLYFIPSDVCREIKKCC